MGGDQTRELVAMRQGVIDLVVSSTINLAPQIREMNLFSLPFLMPDSRAFDALTQGRPVRAATRWRAGVSAMPSPWPGARTASASSPTPSAPCAGPKT